MANFVKFTPAQELEIRLWVRNNFEDMATKSNVWHPIVVDEVTKIINETNTNSNVQKNTAN